MAADKSNNPEADATARRTGKSRFYTPRAILPLPGIKHNVMNEFSDSYAGEAEALERAGILTADMLPKPGQCTVTWRPVGQKVDRESACYEPGYLRVIRDAKGSGYRVFITVSREERARRRAERERKKQEWQRERAANAAPAAQQSPEEEIVKLLRGFPTGPEWMMMRGGTGHPVGTRLIDSDGDEITVVKGLGFYKVLNQYGEFCEENGARFDWRLGYLCQQAAGSFFCPPHALYDVTGAVTHMRLAHAAEGVSKGRP